MRIKKTFTLLTCLMLGAWLTTGSAWSMPGHGQGSGKGQTLNQPAQGQQGQQHGQRAEQPTDRGRQGEQRGDLDRREQKIHLASGERDCFNKASRQSSRAERQAHGMAAYARGTDFDREMAVRQRDTLRDHVRELFREHDRMTAGLGDADRAAVQDRLRKLDKVRDRMRTHLEQMDHELAANGLPERFERCSREVARDLEKWNKQHRRLGERFDIDAG